MRQLFESYNRNNYNKCGFHIIAHYFGLPGADPTIKSVLQTRPSNDTSIVSSSRHFRIHFDTSGVNEPALYNSNQQPISRSAFAFADSVAKICDHVYEIEVDSLGFPPPAADSGAGGGDEYDIYIEALPTGEYGYTDWDPSLPVINRVNATYATWTVIRNEFHSTYTQGIPAMEVTLAHEFNHGIQVGNYGLWQNDLWFYELTSTWMEQVVYPGVKDYYQYLPGFFGNLNRKPFNEYDPGVYAGYERCVFGIFVQNEYGSGLMKSIWQNMSKEPAIPAIEGAFKLSGTTAFTAFQLFSEWNYFTGYRSQLASEFGVSTYPQAPDYPLGVIEGAGSLSNSGVAFSGQAQRLTEHFFQVDVSPDTIGIVVSNNNFSAAAVYDTTNFSFSVGISNGGSNCVKELSGGNCLYFDVTDYSNWSLLPLLAGGALVAETNVVFPQPFNPSVQDVKIPYPFTQTNGATLSIYGVSGDLINELQGDSHISRYLRGSYFVWDGKDKSGRDVATGVYIYVVTDGSKSMVGKVAVVRN
jgi:Family of unknown function (DUF6055)